ncbi:MAG TPA: hypothetical protein VFQ70_03980 [Candidatus Saccharimonadaceae bacterium]|nr:hypothetical protein [Candidatus Saccharimonadaceae bacterium]
MAFQSYLCMYRELVPPTNAAETNRTEAETLTNCGFPRWAEVVGSDAQINSQEAQPLYLTWSVVEKQYAKTANRVKIIPSSEFAMGTLGPDYRAFVVRALERATRYQLFSTYFVAVYEPYDRSADDEFVLVGCTDNRTLKQPMPRETHRLYEEILQLLRNDIELLRTYEGSLDVLHRTDNETVASREEQLRDMENREFAIKRLLSEDSRDKVDAFSTNPQNVFAICRFTKGPCFAEDGPRTTKTTAPPATVKPPRFKVTTEELNRLPHSRSVIHAAVLVLLYVMSIGSALMGLWTIETTSLLIFLLYTMRSGLIFGTVGQVDYLKAKHAVLPRKYWQWVE